METLRKHRGFRDELELRLKEIKVHKIDEEVKKRH